MNNEARPGAGLRYFGDAMSVDFRILPRRGLVYIRYEGLATVRDSLAAFDRYARHPDCRPGQKQLVDLSRITAYDRDFPKLFELQARKADVFMAEGAQTLVMYYAPTKITQEIAHLVERSWEPFPAVVALVQANEADALALLGQKEPSFEELLAAAV